jgi:splicing factor 3B subunit 1
MPLVASAAAPAAAAVPKRSRWDETPLSGAGGALAAGAAADATPLGAGSFFGAAAAAAAASAGAAGDGQPPLSDAELDELLPAEGYRVLEAPASYVPLRTDAARRLAATPGPVGTPGFTMAATPARADYGVPATPSERRELGGAPAGDLPFLRPEDAALFPALVGPAGAKAEDELTPAEATARRVAVLLLKIKSGTAPQRKDAQRALSEGARKLGAGPIFSALLPLLMSPTLEAAERHMLVRAVDRVLFSLDELVRPYAHKILVVAAPLLIDDDFYARTEGRELIANLAKAAGLATMIAVMRPDIDSPDDYTRNTTALTLVDGAGRLLHAKRGKGGT